LLYRSELYDSREFDPLLYTSLSTTVNTLKNPLVTAILKPNLPFQGSVAKIVYLILFYLRRQFTTSPQILEEFGNIILLEEAVYH
jgi:hypothetical protein